jgi:N-acetyl-anhydromuramyl-L-alanine amidase AmpD
MATQPIVFRQLTKDQADQVKSFHAAHGASVDITPDGAGTFTVTASYPDVPAGPTGAGGPPATGGQAAGTGGGPSGAGNDATVSLWQQLATAYKAYRGASDNLKVASLAQWALESGRGTSALAVQQLNFGGIKYRDRMAGFAVPVTYTGSDGETTAYCKFSSVAAFIDGYWRFIQTGPYTGWQRFSNDAAGYINFIAPNYAGDPQYPQKVSALFDEARRLLGLPATVGQTGLVTPAQPAWTELTAKFLNKRTTPIQGIVLHDTAGAGTHNDTLYLTNPQDGRKVSVDFTVEKDGSIFKLNPDLPSFYCNHAGRSTKWLGFKNAQVNAASIGIEIVQSDKLKGPPFYPTAQVQSVARLCAWLGTQFDFNNSRITTHRQVITDGSRSDPRMFPFDDFWAAYWVALGRGASFQNAMAGNADGDDSSPGDLNTTSSDF